MLTSGAGQMLMEVGSKLLETLYIKIKGAGTTGMAGLFHNGVTCTVPLRGMWNVFLFLHQMAKQKN